MCCSALHLISLSAVRRRGRDALCSKVKSPQDYIGGVALMALALFALVGVERPAGHARIFVRRRDRAAACSAVLLLALGRRDRAGRACRPRARHLADYSGAGRCSSLLAIVFVCAGDPAAGPAWSRHSRAS